MRRHTLVGLTCVLAACADEPTAPAGAAGAGAGGAGATGTAGTGGSAGSAGVGGSVGSAGEGGSAGSAGKGGASGGAGGSGAAGQSPLALVAPARTVVATQTHTCVIVEGGRVRCWGDNSGPLLGYGLSAPSRTPEQLGPVPVGGKVTQVVTGIEHACALLDTGKVRCWGLGNDGVLGYANPYKNLIGDDELASAGGDVPVGGKVVQVSTGSNHTCALLDTGNIRCWGQGSRGRLGYGNTKTIGDDETPASAGDVPVGANVVQVSAGDTHTCALLGTGKVRCWGDGSDGRLGHGDTNDIGDDEPASAGGDVDVGGKVVQIAAGGGQTCALLDTGSVRCWGQGSRGRLGYGNTKTIGDDETPASAGDVPVGANVVQISAGLSATCALLDTGNVRCWGAGDQWELGYGTTSDIGDDELASAGGDVPIGGKVVQLTAGDFHTCAVIAGGSVRCWGGGGNASVLPFTPRNVGDDEPASALGDVPLGGNAVSLAASFSHTCALLDTGKVRCWGDASGGYLGHGDRVDIGDDEPASAGGEVPVGGKVVQIAAAYSHTCALLDTGKVRCWGAGQHGQLGYGNTSDIGGDEPASAGGDVDVGGKVVQIAASGSHTCALLAAGDVRCWGENSSGQLGYGNTDDIGDDETPASAGDVPVGANVVQIGVGDAYSCALLDTGNVRCWGAGSVGSLGYGTTENITTASAGGDVPIGGRVVQLSAGLAHACALLDTGKVRCWGLGNDGSLGYGNTKIIGDDEPASAGGDVDVGGKVVQVVAGGGRTCAVLDTGALRCWGQSMFGTLGHGDLRAIGDDETPASAGDVPVGGKVMLP